jgi:hypothetical protein
MIPIIRPGKRLRDTYKNTLTAKKGEMSVYKPKVNSYFDHTSDEYDSVITPGGMTTISGKRLKFSLNDKDVGIIYIDENGVETKVEIVAVSKPSELIFVAPLSLKRGEYVVGVRTKSGKNLKLGTFSQSLRVN